MILLADCNKRVKSSFSRAAGSYERYADLQSRLEDELLELVLTESRTYRRILDIGCGPGRLLKGLKAFCPGSCFAGLDLSCEMLRQVRSDKILLSAADAEFLPFSDSSFDLVVSSSTYQWVRDLPAAFKEASRVLSQGGDFIFNCFGSRTLSQMRECLGIEDNPLPEAGFVRESLKEAGFSDINLKVNCRRKYFDNLLDILSWLKFIGANRISREGLFLAPKRLAQANHDYCRAYRENGRVYAGFEVIQVKVKK